MNFVIGSLAAAGTITLGNAILSVTGAADLSAGPTLNALAGAGSTIGDTFPILIGGGGIHGNFSGLPDNATLLIDGKTFRVNYTSTRILLTQIGSVTRTDVTSSAAAQTVGQPVRWAATVAADTGSLNFVNFETGDFSQTAAHFTNGAAIVANPALGGSYALELQRTNSVANVELRRSDTNYYDLPTAYYRFLFESTFNPGEGSIVNFHDTASGYKCALHLSAANTLLFYDSGGTLVAAGGTVLTPGQVYAITAKIGTGGQAAWEIRINGNVEMSGNGNLGARDNGSLELGGNAPYTATYYYDDVAINSLAYPGSVPTGLIQFAIDGADFGAPVVLSDGTATSALTGTLSAGHHVITATYMGDRIYSPTSGTLSGEQTITQATADTALVSSADQSVFGQAVTLTAIVTGPLPPTGSVIFRDGTRVLGESNLADGRASVTTAALGAGTHDVTAVYIGDTNFSTSVSAILSHTVAAAATKTIILGANPSVFGQSITLTATVTVVSPGAGTPTGTVSFLDGTTTLGTAKVDTSGLATLTISTLGAGTHALTALYSGELNFGISMSARANQIINQAATTTMLASLNNPAAGGQSVTFVINVTATTPTPGAPTGTVTFRNGTLVMGEGALTNGQVVFAAAGLVPGTYVITAVYNGDANFSRSTSVLLTQTITPVLPVPPGGGAGSDGSGGNTSGGSGSNGSGAGSGSGAAGGGAAGGSGSGGTARVDVALFGLPGNGILLGSTASVVGQTTTSSGTALSADSIRPPGLHPSSASAGQGSGSDDITALRIDIPPSELRFEPGLPSSNDLISGVDLAGSLLTGARPTASLMPQKGSSIAPVATVVIGGGREEQPDPSTEEKSLWPNFVIGLDDTIDRRPVVPPEPAPNSKRTFKPDAESNHREAEIPSETAARSFLNAVERASDQVTALFRVLGTTLFLAGILSTLRRSAAKRGTPRETATQP